MARRRSACIEGEL
ncbi:hypothetical protein YPPY71_0238, partial [Yersinia pestis PY-71]